MPTWSLFRPSHRRHFFLLMHQLLRFYYPYCYYSGRTGKVQKVPWTRAATRWSFAFCTTSSSLVFLVFVLISRCTEWNSSVFLSYHQHIYPQCTNYTFVLYVTRWWSGQHCSWELCYDHKSICNIFTKLPLIHRWRIKSLQIISMTHKCTKLYCG